MKPWPVLALTAVLLGRSSSAAQPPKELGPLTFREIPDARYAFHGPVGDRIQANVDHWLLRAPQANPGMLAMFQRRDRQPPPQLVPWAGEFVGKYLISAIQASRLTYDPRLTGQVSTVVSAFVGTQADDGYLGPFPREERLLKHWDLWGHFHAIQALLLWHEQTGDPAALTAARRAGDLVCQTYLNSGRRVLEAGDPEMNLAILTGLLALYRVTGEDRYLAMAREVETDWQQAGDYLRSGLDGREFYQSPRPRWESLHSLQGLLEFWRITGDPKYRDAFVHHWRSIRRWDRRNTGGFSSGEQATGDPYAPTAIETCCTVAWMALTVDYLRLTGDARAADDLELATLNAGLGAQHPSGRWWTYNTPMDGVREASAHTIVFQARAGTPELNCCSVNGPRVLGMLSDWAVMSGPDGVILNWLLPFEARLPLGTGRGVGLSVSGDYPRSGSIRIRLQTPEEGTEFVLRLRVPQSVAEPRYTIRSGHALVGGGPAGPGYLTLRRHWQSGDQIDLQFDLPIRAVPGALETAGKVSLYRGPLLLAFDPAYNDFDADTLPPLDLRRLADASLIDGSTAKGVSPALPGPWLMIEVPASRPVRLVDFASAGSTGAPYWTWLPPLGPLPSPTTTEIPSDGAKVRPEPIRFQWRGERAGPSDYRVEFSTDEAFGRMVFVTNTVTGTRMTLDAGRLAGAAGSASTRLFWRVTTIGDSGDTIPDSPPAWFEICPDAPPQELPRELITGPEGEVIQHSLRNSAPPEFGPTPGLPGGMADRGADGTRLDGQRQSIVYDLPGWPAEDLTLAVRVRLDAFPEGRLGQVFSAWTAAMDDPLRLVIDRGRLYARVEAGGGSSTPGVAFETGRWYAVVAVRHAATLTLYVDGRQVGRTSVPAVAFTRSQACALGGNPRFSGNEHLAAAFADFSLWERAWRDAEIQRWSAGR